MGLQAPAMNLDCKLIGAMVKTPYRPPSSPVTRNLYGTLMRSFNRGSYDIGRLHGLASTTRTSSNTMRRISVSTNEDKKNDKKDNQNHTKKKNTWVGLLPLAREY